MMLKSLVFSSAMMMAGAAMAQTASPGGTMAPPAMPGKGANGMAPMSTMAPSSAANLSATDKRFVNKLASANSAEIQAWQMAEQKAGDPKVKDMAQTMVTDHTQAGEKLNALAQQKGLTIPTELESKDQKEIDKFTKLSGKKFDKAFVKDQTKDHEDVLALLKKESSGGKDADLKSFAEMVTPTIQKHLDMLQNKGS